MPGKTAPYPLCPYCGSGFMIQAEWDDDAYGEQNEINRTERWACEECGKSVWMHVHYKMDWYAIPMKESEQPDVSWTDEDVVYIEEE